MDSFQGILIVMGVIAIVMVLIHGFITKKKTKELHEKKNKLSLKKIDKREEYIVDATVEIDSFNAETEDVTFDFPEDLDEAEKEDMSFDTEFKAELKEESEIVFSETLETETETEIEAEASGIKPAPVKEDVFIFNVVPKEGKTLGGHELLQYFLTSGFRIGEMSIFHRHVHSDGTGAILFSIANMMAPGTFDVDHMEQLKSEGVSFFFRAPNDEIEVKKAFDMMLVAVEIMAEEFDCDVLNGKRELFTEKEFFEYQDCLAHYK